MGRTSGTMSSAVFWRLLDRLQIPDPDALELIGYAGKVGKASKRPRSRLSSRQTGLTSYIPVFLGCLGVLFADVMERTGDQGLDFVAVAGDIGEEAIHCGFEVCEGWEVLICRASCA